MTAVVSSSLEAKNLAGWVTPWDDPKALQAFATHAGDVDVIWSMGLQYTGQGQVVYEEAAAVTELVKERSSKNKLFGPVLHNMRNGAFDSALGEDLLRHRSQTILALKELVKKHGWTALNIDLESIDKKSAPQYEAFLKALHKAMPSVALSVDLHAKTSEPGPYPGSHFQRWKQLSRIPLQFVVMAYDHSWPTSDPGPVAPEAWVLQVADYAARVFPKDKLVMALPQYGYHWRRSGERWQGEPHLTPVIVGMVDSAWKTVATLKNGDGQGYGKDDQAIYFDDAAAFSAKVRALRERGFSKFAVWRLAGTDPSFFSAWRQIK